MDKNILIRKCEKRNEEEYIKLNLEFMEAVRSEHPYWNNLKFPTVEEMKGVFQEAITSPEKIQIFIAEKNNEVIGFANTWCVYSIWTQGQSLIIDDLYVAKEQRKQGIGMALMEFLIDYAKSNGFKRVELKAEKDNYIAHKLYKKLGFDDEEMVFFMKKL